jgi:hypothetical protein
MGYICGSRVLERLTLASTKVLMRYATRCDRE